jgi:cysteine-rich repeat protein
LNLTFFGEGNHEITATAYVNNPSGLDCSEDDPSRRTVNVVDNRTFCGDNVMQSPNDFGQLEECDDGANGDNNDQCDDSCHLTSCGDLFVQQPNGLGTGGPLNDGVEDCDDGADGDDTDRCYDHCEFTFCGDSIIQDPNGYGVNEDCDDGNLDETDDCANDCSLTYCGDSLTQSPNGAGQLEECDDGQDGDNTNQCDDSCHRTSCGDGFVQTPNGLGVGGPNDDGVEACDDGNDVDDDACNNNCELTSCGDNVVNNGEDCDDGQNGDDTDGCNDQCSFTFCGDNVVQQPNGEGDVEFCDDGANGDDTDGCDDWCHLTFCGDNIVQDPNGLGNLGATGIGDEECDDGANGNNSDNCLDNCTSTSCGDGYVQSILGEECDDANSNSSDSCNSCSLTVCGDSIIQSPNGYLQLEECDDGADGDNSNECDDSCHRTSCGDGFVQAPNGIGIGGPQNDGVEECDDGNLNSTDSCNNQCISNVCGDGIVNNNEPCDDGANGDDTDGCTDSCELTFCGDETVQQPNGYGDVEFCDDGANGNDADLCDDWCHLTFCGDNIVQYPNGLGEDGLNDSGLELCDDGSNGNDTDFCYDDCTPTFCGDGILQTVNGEVCDDGNDYENDTCNNACQLTVCGDGIQQIGNGYDGQLEECDDGADGNNSNLCDDSCHRTSCGDAIVQSPNGLGNGGPLNDGYEECDDGNQVHNDSCRNDCSWAPVCSDGQDNDGDGFIDFPADPGCEGPDDTSEFDDCTLFHDVNNQTLPNPLAFAPQVFLDPESREVIDDDDPSCDEVTRNYAFEGEQISVDVLVWDKNGVPNKIFDVYWGLGRDGPPSTTRCVESNCNFIGCRDEDNDQECDDPPGVLIGDPVPLVWDGNTMGWYECILTVEPGWHGQYWASVQAVDNDGLVGQIDEQEFWFFNPTYTIEVSDDIVFDNLAAGTRSYARTVSVQNNAELNSGLMLDMYIGGNNDFDLTSFGAACPTSNQMRLNYNQDNYCDGYDDPNNSGATNAIHDNFCYYGTSGSYSTCSNEGTDPECYDEINYALPGQTQNARRVLQFDTGIPGTSATLLTPNSEFYNYSSNRRFELLVDGNFISFLFTNNDNLSAVQVAQEINTEAAIVDTSLSMIASVEGGQVRITSPTTGTSSTIVILDGSGNPQLGFSDFDSDSGTDGVFATNVETIGCGQYPSGNVLAPGQEMSVTMRLDVPIPCNGNFGPVFDNIYFWGEPI